MNNQLTSTYSLFFAIASKDCVIPSIDSDLFSNDDDFRLALASPANFVSDSFLGIFLGPVIFFSNDDFCFFIDFSGNWAVVIGCSGTDDFIKPDCNKAIRDLRISLLKSSGLASGSSSLDFR